MSAVSRASGRGCLFFTSAEDGPILLRETRPECRSAPLVLPTAGARRQIPDDLP